jgi:hypothetical protein
MQDAATPPAADGRSGATPADRPPLGEMLGEVADLSAGLGTVLLPLFLPAVPGFMLFVVLPALLLLAVVAAPLAVLGAIAGPAYLVARAVRRTRTSAGRRMTGRRPAYGARPRAARACAEPGPDVRSVRRRRRPTPRPSSPPR